MVAAADGKARRFWFDPRFAVGILLIVASVVGVCLLLSAQNRSVQVYVARATLVTGDRVSPGDVELVSVRVPRSDRYLAAGGLQSDEVVVRSVPKGELVPVSALSRASDASLTSVVVKASGPVAAAVAAGTTADVWAAHSANDKNYTPPAVLVSGAIVVSIVHDEALVADRGSVSVELRVPAGRVASILQAIADGQVISVVPASADAASPGPAGSRSAPTKPSTPEPTDAGGGTDHAAPHSSARGNG
ncbi:hypothetical protein GCM10028798_24940 [Humibacter antri]